MTDLRSDTYVLNGVTSPGACEILGASNPRNWQEQAGFGFSGASLVGGTAKLARFSILHKILTSPGDPFAAEWLDWETFKPLVEKPLPGVRPPSLGIYHPQLADLGISAVVVEDRTQWTQDAYGLWTMVIKFIEYRAPMIMVAKAGPGVPAAQKGTPRASDVHAAELEAAMAGFRAAAGAH